MKKFAMIGCGGIGGYHLSHLINFKDIELAGFCDLIADKAEKFVKSYGSGRAFTDFREMLDAVKPDAVFICVPPNCHGEIEFELIERGIHFFVEKPVALDLGLARRIRDAAEAKKLITAVGFQCRYDNINEAAQAFAAENEIVAVEASRVGGVPDPLWWRKKDESGGQLVEQTIHQVDILRYILGDADTVYSLARRGFVTQDEWPEYDTDDMSASLIRFKNGVVCHMFTGCYSLAGAAWDSKMTFGSRSSRLEYRLCNKSSIFSTVEKKTDENAVGGIIAGDGTNFGATETVCTEVKSEVDFGTLCDRTFVDAVITGDASKIRSPYADGLRSIALGLACNESMATGMPVKVEPD